MVAIVSADLLLNYTTSGAKNSAQTNELLSLGPNASSSLVATGANGIFADISSVDNIAKTPHYRVIALFNNTASGNTLQNAVFYFSGTAPAPAYATAVVDTAAAAAIAAAAMAGNGGVALTNETTAPTAVSFPALGTASTPLTYQTGLAVGSLPPGQVKFVHLRLEPQNTAAGVVSLSLELDGDTAN
jgi:hypothetical protein